MTLASVVVCRVSCRACDSLRFVILSSNNDVVKSRWFHLVVASYFDVAYGSELWTDDNAELGLIVDKNVGGTVDVDDLDLIEAISQELADGNRVGAWSGV